MLALRIGPTMIAIENSGTQRTCESCESCSSNENEAAVGTKNWEPRRRPSKSSPPEFLNGGAWHVNRKMQIARELLIVAPIEEVREVLRAEPHLRPSSGARRLRVERKHERIGVDKFKVRHFSQGEKESQCGLNDQKSCGRAQGRSKRVGRPSCL